MFTDTFDTRNYINFLYYSPESDSKFDKRDLVTIYKNKYERLSKQKLSQDPKSTNSIILILNSIIAKLRENLPIYLNDKRIESYIHHLSTEKYDKVIYNQCVSISLIEVYTNDDDLWEYILSQVKSLYSNTYDQYFYDDSKDSYRILTCEIPILDYTYSDNTPDIEDYNIDSVLSYYETVGDIPVMDNSIKNIFTAELKSYNSGRIVEGGLFEHIFKQIENMDFAKMSFKDTQNLVRDILSYMSEDNANHIIFLQYKMIKKVFKEASYMDSEFEGVSFTRSLMAIICSDISIYNYVSQLNYSIIEKVYLAYNYHIIKIQDMIDSTDPSYNAKKIALLMYKNQLCKSRNKLQERMRNNE